MKLNHHLNSLLIAFSLITASIGLADEPSTKEVLNNASIIELKELGLGESLIIEKIKISQCDFDVTIAGLKQLKAAAVPESILSAMLSAKSGAQVAANATVEQAGDLNDPMAPHESGIWLYEESDGKAKMTQLEPSVYSQTKTSVAIFAQFGQSAKSSAVVASAHAGITTSDRQPTFYFYFERTQSGFSDNRQSATSANEYILAQFEVLESDNQRRLGMGSMNAYAGGERGAEGKSVRSFNFEKLSPGVYKVTPKEILSNGEYGFYYGGQTGSGKVFDFGVNGPAETEPKPVIEEKVSETPKKGLKNPFKKKS